MHFNTEIEIDLNEVKQFVEDTEFHQFLLTHAPSFETAAFILQSLLNAIAEASANQAFDNIE